MAQVMINILTTTWSSRWTQADPSLQFSVALLALVAFFTNYALAVSPLVVQGSDFVNSVDNTRFQIIGVA